MHELISDIFFFAFTLFFLFIGLVFLVRPLAYYNLPWVRGALNPTWISKPWTRIQMRAVGLVFSLFALCFFSGVLAGVVKSRVLAALRDSLYVAVLITFFSVWAGGVLSWILWRVGPIRSFISSRYAGKAAEDPEWNQRETFVFCSLLLLILAGAILTGLAGARR